MKTLISRERIINRKLPNNFIKSDTPFFIREFSKKIHNSFLFELNYVFVTPSGIIINWFKVIQETVISINKNYGLRFILKSLLKRPNLLINSNKYILVHNELSNAYFHWITEVLPRLFIIRKNLNNKVLILPENLSSFHYLSLTPFKIKNTCIIKNNSFLFVRNLISPGHLAGSGNFNEKIIYEMGSYFSNYFNGVSPYGKRIYISRKKAEIRKVANEDDLLPVLKKYDFDVIYFEDFSFDKQVIISKNANVIIGIHGAGLTNMIFMNKPGKVLELRKEGDTKNLCYFSLASAMCLDYYYQFGRPTIKVANTRDADIVINPIGFEKIIRLLLNEE